MPQDDSVKQKVLDQADIVEIVGQYVRLQKRGGRYFGLCPFHSEKTPSFSVNAERGFYHCFGCKAGGNAIDFVMGMENLSFVEALTFLANRLNIPMSPPSHGHGLAGGKQQKYNEIDRYQVMEKATIVYERWLDEHGYAKNYLLQRGLSSEQIKQFTLGYVPDGWDHIRNALQRHNIPIELLAELGLIVPRQTGNGYYDRFRNRIIFPIRNTLGRVIAFGGRAMDPNDNAKYLNSNDTSLFNKSKVLYLLDKAKHHLKEKGVIVVEGYMDAIALHIAGFPQTVAVLGTALTPQHVKTLRRYTNDFTLLYDGDTAGQNAAKRGVETFFSEGLTTKVILLPEGQDPDDYIKAHGAEAMGELIRNASDGFDYYFHLVLNQHDPSTPNGKLAVIDGMVPLLALIPDKLILHDYVERISNKMGFPMDELKQSITQRLKKNRTMANQRNEQTAVPAADAKANHPYVILKETLIRLLAFHQGYLIPDDMPLSQKPNLFTEEELSQQIPSALTPLKDGSKTDKILGALLTDIQSNVRQQSPGDRRGASFLEALLPETEQRMYFIDISEREPLPDTEKQLRKEHDQVMQQLVYHSSKQSYEEFKRQGDLKALNELLWSKDTSEIKSSFF